jgi:hypothetical protein
MVNEPDVSLGLSGSVGKAAYRDAETAISSATIAPVTGTGHTGTRSVPTESWKLNVKYRNTNAGGHSRLLQYAPSHSSAPMHHSAPRHPPRPTRLRNGRNTHAHNRFDDTELIRAFKMLAPNSARRTSSAPSTSSNTRQQLVRPDSQTKHRPHAGQRGVTQSRATARKPR